ncbi:MAG: GNAT family N-acetyltransferase [Lachnospiraceae bacterium]|nr:GNAT family N-acetyltransferase [Lachnospiraceae bacterium]
MNKNYFITTERIGFSKWKPEDYELAELLWGNPEATRYICASGIFRPADIENRLGLEIFNGEKYGVQYWPIFKLATGELVGCCGLRPHENHALRDVKDTESCDSNEHFDGQSGDVYEIGFHLRPQFWRKGFAKEAAEAVMDYAFKKLKAQKLFAGHNPKNIASKKLLGKLGFTYIGDEFYEPTGLYHPSYEKLSM